MLAFPYRICDMKKEYKNFQDRDDNFLLHLIYYFQNCLLSLSVPLNNHRTAKFSTIKPAREAARTFDVH
jgi:hypothetical protein